MNNITKEKIKQSKLGMLVFSPDAIKSNSAGKRVKNVRAVKNLWGKCRIVIPPPIIK
jgi:hypothetical protein